MRLVVFNEGRLGCQLDDGSIVDLLLYAPGEVRLRAPLPSLASRIAMAGANFYDHTAGVLSMMRGVEATPEDVRRAVERGEMPPWGFWKFAKNVIGPEEPIIYPSAQGDWTMRWRWRRS